MLKKVINYLPGVAIPMVINFLITMLYAAYLEPGEFGILNVYLTTIQIIYSLTISVFQTACLRFYTMGEHKTEEEFVSSYIFANIITTLIIVPILIIVSLFLNFNWWIVVISVGLNGLFQFFCNYFRVINKAKEYNLMRMVSSILGLGLLIVVSRVIKPLSFVWPLLVVFGSYGVVSFYELLRVKDNISIRKLSLVFIKKSVIYGFPLIGVSILSYVVASSDQYLILYFLGESAVGNYSLGYRLVDALTVNLLTVILLVMTPELNRQHDLNGANLSQEVLKNMISAAIWIILPLSFAIIVYANYIVSYIFPAYTGAAHIMRLVIFASIFHGIAMFTCKGLELIKKPKYVFYSLLVAAIINIIYNLIFIPVYGIDASAHSSLIAYIVYNLLLLIFTRRFYSISLDIKYLAKTVIATLITVLAAVIMMNIVPITSIWFLAFEAIVCVIVYVGASFIFKLWRFGI